MTGSNWAYSNLDRNGNDVTPNVENFEDRNFPASRANCDRQAPTHHNRYDTGFRIWRVWLRVKTSKSLDIDFCSMLRRLEKHLENIQTEKS